jgi:hypothetical protein
VVISPPEVSWPDFPDPQGSVGRLSEDTFVPAGVVVMKMDYWLALARYVVDVDAIKEIIEAWRADNGAKP